MQIEAGIGNKDALEACFGQFDETRGPKGNFGIWEGHRTGFIKYQKYHQTNHKLPTKNSLENPPDDFLQPQNFILA